MSTIKIGTLNIRNSKINRSDTARKCNTKALANHIENNDYYFLGTQELTRNFSSKLSENLNTYKLYGDYRFGVSKFVRNIKILDSYNENNAIITNKDVRLSDTRKLPWFPINIKDLIISLKKASIMPRIVTLLEILDNNLGSVFAINTHLDYQLKSVQIKQLKELYNIIRNFVIPYYTYIFEPTPSYLSGPFLPVILTGDFNMEVGVDSHFDEFIAALNKIGLKRIEITDKTNSSKFDNKTSIDHIFIPKEWQVEEAGLIDDNKGVYAKVKIK